jgi:hypothetical protein
MLNLLKWLNPTLLVLEIPSERRKPNNKKGTTPKTPKRTPEKVAKKPTPEKPTPKKPTPKKPTPEQKVE